MSGSAAGSAASKEPADPAENELFEAEGKAEEDGDWDLAAELDTRIWVDGWIDGVNQPDTRVDPAIRAAIKGWDRELLEPGRVYGSFDSARDPPAIERLEEIALPTLVVIGELDTTGTRAAAEEVADAGAAARGSSGSRTSRTSSGWRRRRPLAALIVEHLAPLPRWA